MQDVLFVAVIFIVDVEKIADMAERYFSVKVEVLKRKKHQRLSSLNPIDFW